MLTLSLWREPHKLMHSQGKLIIKRANFVYNKIAFCCGFFPSYFDGGGRAAGQGPQILSCVFGSLDAMMPAYVIYNRRYSLCISFFPSLLGLVDFRLIDGRTSIGEPKSMCDAHAVNIFEIKYPNYSPDY